MNENETDAVGCVLRAGKVYKVFGAEAQVETDYFEGKHQISGKRAYDFLMEKLSEQP
jgi:hypothetical protein